MLKLIQLLIVVMLGVSLVAAQDDETYVVQRGDTLDTIAQEYNVSLEALRIANDLVDSSVIFPGDSLVIPADAPPYGTVPALDTPDLAAGGGAGGGLAGEVYVVQRGDTLDTIAQEYDVAVESLYSANDLENSVIFPGQSLLIPEDAPAYGVTPARESTVDTSAGAGGGLAGELYVIQLMDTIDQLGADFNVATACLLEANPQIVNVRSIVPGDTVLIPEDCPPYAGFGVPRTTMTTTTADTDADTSDAGESEEADPEAGEG